MCDFEIIHFIAIQLFQVFSTTFSVTIFDMGDSHLQNIHPCINSQHPSSGFSYGVQVRYRSVGGARASRLGAVATLVKSIGM